jgi:hypothetical protein
MGGVDGDVRLICKLSEGLTVFSSVPVLVKNDGFHQTTIIANGDDVVLDPGEGVALPWPPEKKAVLPGLGEDEEDWICKLPAGFVITSTHPLVVRNDTGIDAYVTMFDGERIRVNRGEKKRVWPVDIGAIVAEVCEDLAETHRDRSGGMQWSPEDIERFKAEMDHRAAVREEVYRGLHAPKVIGVINDPNGGRVGEVKG